MTENEIKWIYVETFSIGGVGYDEYVSEDGLLCRRVWHDDDYEEIYEIG